MSYPFAPDSTIIKINSSDDVYIGYNIRKLTYMYKLIKISTGLYV